MQDKRYNKIVLIPFTLITVLTIYFLYFLFIPHTKNYAVVEIKHGTSANNIIHILESKNIVKKSLLFKLSTHALYKTGKQFVAGEYEFFIDSSAYDVLKKLTNGDIIQHFVTIPEGLTINQISNLLSQTYGITGDFPKNCTEGLLMPDTYQYIYGDSKDKIISSMKNLSNDFLQSKINLPLPTPLKNMQDVIKLASIVEMETLIDDEYKKIAKVYLNRLNKNMLLQADPTIIYAITKGDNNFKQRLLFKDLKLKTPYNTYLNKGLPPTAICNPSRQAIDAVLNPDDTDALYFVADGKGGHIFSNSFAEHKKRVRHYKTTDSYKNLKNQKR